MEENDIQGKSKKIKKDKKVKKQKKKKGIFGKFIGLLFLLAIIAGVIYFFNLGKYFSIFDKVDNPAGEYLIPLWLEPDMTTWQIDNKIEEPISVMSSDTDVILGDYEKYGIEILIPGGAFNQPTELVLKKPEGDMLYDKNAMSPLGTAASFSILGEQTRSNLPMKVKVKVSDKDLIDESGVKGIHVSDDGVVTYINILKDDGNNDYLVYELYYNFFVSTAELTEAERIEKFAKEKSLESWAKKNMDEEIKAVTSEMIEQMLIQSFNVNNPSEIEIIVKAAVGEMKYGTLEYGKVGVDLYNGDTENLVSTVGTILGNTLALNIDSDLLESVVDKAGTGASALGNLTQGDISGAGLQISNYIMDKSPFVKAGKVWIEVVNTKISNWKNNEIENAYIAYRDGTESQSWFGYKSIDPGNFEAVYDQMRGSQRQFEIDAIQSYLNVHGKSESDLSEADRISIINNAKTNLKKQFDMRIEQEDQIAGEEANQREIINQFNEWGLLKKGASWYPEDSDIEQILTRLYNQITRIQEDVGRFEIVYRDGDLHDQSRGLDNIGKLKDDEMLMSDLAKLINTRYVYGEEAYSKLLVEMGYIVPVDIEGTWEGTFQLKETNRANQFIGPIVETIKSAINSLARLFGSNSEAEVVFNEYDFQVYISNYESSSGNCQITATVSDEFEDYTKTVDGKFSKGVLTFSIKDEENYEFSFKGSFTGNEKISGDFSLHMFILLRDAGSGEWQMQRIGK